MAEIIDLDSLMDKTYHLNIIDHDSRINDVSPHIVHPDNSRAFDTDPRMVNDGSRTITTDDARHGLTDNSHSTKTDNTGNTDNNKAPDTLRAKRYLATFGWPIDLSQDELSDITDQVLDMLEESEEYGVGVEHTDNDVREYGY